MNNFSGPEFAKASRIIQALRRNNLAEVPLPKPGSVIGVFENPATLLQSLQHFHPNSVGLFIVDPPRATARESARLWDLDVDGRFATREVSRDDPDYRYHLAATVLAAVRLMTNALHPEGWITAFATTDTYMMVRGALEQYLGFDRFRGELVYQTKSGGSNDSNYIVTEHESILAFSASSNARNLRISKEQGELARYNLEDDQGRFFWDTFPRKNARNYYPITCPDGSVLDFDDDGNRISWLWSESTFKKAYAKGDVELRQVDGAWKAYFKDRLKARKVVRSLTLHGSSLGEILGTGGESDGSGRDLQTATGTREVRAFPGIKPDYIKPSRLFSFLIEAFDQGVGPTVVPFSDRGSSAQAGYLKRLYNGTTMEGLLVNGTEAGEALWEWRLLQAPQEVREAATVLSPLPVVPLDELLLGQLTLEQLTSLVSLESGSSAPWNTLKLGTIHGLWRDVQGQVDIVLQGPTDIIPDHECAELASIVGTSASAVRFWGTGHADLMSSVLRTFGRTSSYRSITSFFTP